jgi:uncharacterized protein YecE (DUF72 family)
VFDSWRTRAPSGFIFAVKASCFLTHMKKLKDPEEPIERLFSRRHTIEFREPRWYVDEVLALLERHKIALCLHDMPGSASPRTVTARFVYVRFHGAAGRYRGGYPRQVLDQWARWLHSTRVPAYVYFNNDVGGQAPRDAHALRSVLV